MKNIWGILILCAAPFLVPTGGYCFSAEIPFSSGAVVKTGSQGTLQFGNAGGGDYVINQYGEAVFNIGTTEWDLDCRNLPCRAQSGPFILSWTQNHELVLKTLENQDGRMSLKRSNRTRDFLSSGPAPLSNFEVDQLRLGGFLIIEKNEFIVATLNLTGIGTVLDFMNWADNDQKLPVKIEPSPLEYMQTMVDYAAAPRDILVPFTKPQVQFAIREQHGNPFVP